MVSPETSFAPRWASPPGDTIRAAIGEQSITVKKLAGDLGRPLTWVHRLLEGNESISIESREGLPQLLAGRSSFG